MFTGIIEATGTVAALEKREGGVRLSVTTALDVGSLPLGASIAVDGVCLTVIERASGAVATFAADFGPETLARTTLGALRPGARVHLERPLRLGDALGGHLVSGHVDGVGTVVARRPVGDALELDITAPESVARTLVPKGSVTVAGASLTINTVGDISVNQASSPARAGWFSVTLIPHTLAVTTLGELAVGAPVNLEGDLIAKHVDRLVTARLDRETSTETMKKKTESHAMSTLTDIKAGGAPDPERMQAVARAIEDVRAGRMVILVDDEDRENEGDLVLAADLVTPDAINFMARHGRGLICLSLTEERVNALALPLMASSADNRSPRHTAFTVSIDARHGTTTGISARERAETIRVAVARDAGPADVVTPGHVFPLRARRGGVLVRSGHTEGSVDLARLAGREPAAVICEIMREDGEMARMPDLMAFAAQHGLAIVKIADLIEYRLSQEILVRRAAESVVRPRVGGVRAEFRAYVYTTDVEETEYLALVLGDIRPEEPVLVRVQSASVLRDVFAAGPGDDAQAAAVPLRLIEEAGRGVLLYVFPRGRASVLAEFRSLLGAPGEAASVASADESRLRNFGLGAQVLAHLGVQRIRLLTNHPRRIVGVAGYGLEIVECLPIGEPAKVVRLRKVEGDGEE